MPTIKVLVRDKRASNQERLRLVCGNSDYEIAFDFDYEWDAYHTKTARFVWEGGYQDVVFTGSVCKVPVIRKARKIAVGVFVGDLRTTTPAYIEAENSILSDDSYPSEPLPDVFKQMMDLAVEGADKASVSAAMAAQSATEAQQGMDSDGQYAADAEASKKTAEQCAAETMKHKDAVMKSADNAQASAEAAELAALSARASEAAAVQEAQSAQASKEAAKQAEQNSRDFESAARTAALGAERSADKAEAAIVNPPKIQNGTWWIYDQSLGAYTDTGEKTIHTTVERWTFELSDGTLVEKDVVVG